MAIELRVNNVEAAPMPGFLLVAIIVIFQHLGPEKVHTIESKSDDLHKAWAEIAGLDYTVLHMSQSRRDIKARERQ